ncbi:unnamed protein product [Coffea canephora]|uniref:DH200=94 genomic scaffold, scaffold_630 n=1 Tax=Coffea canephora TaxID=49390 RepID=A0A068VFZ9_COFCA|nr:unnamed protein product [Coffea canephora]
MEAHNINKDFTVGCILSIKTPLGEEYQGQVLTFDRSSNILVLNILLLLFYQDFPLKRSGPNRNIRLLKANYIKNSEHFLCSVQNSLPQALLSRIGFLKEVLFLPTLNTGDEKVIAGIACLMLEIGQTAPSLILKASPEAVILMDALLRLDLERLTMMCLRR